MPKKSTFDTETSEVFAAGSTVVTPQDEALEELSQVYALTSSQIDETKMQIGALEIAIAEAFPQLAVLKAFLADLEGLKALDEVKLRDCARDALAASPDRKDWFGLISIAKRTEETVNEDQAIAFCEEMRRDDLLKKSLKKVDFKKWAKTLNEIPADVYSASETFDVRILSAGIPALAQKAKDEAQS